MTIQSLGTVVVNDGFYAQVADFFPAAREIATVACMLMYLALMGLARRHPKALVPKRLACAGLIFTAFACIILGLSIETSRPVETLLGMILRLAANCITLVFIGAALCGIKDTVVGCAVIVGSSALSQLVASFLPTFNGFVGIALAMAILAVALVLLYKPAEPFLAGLACGEPLGDLELSNPNAFISWRSGFYTCMLVFGIVFGIALTFTQEVAGPSRFVSCIMFFLVGGWYLFSKNPAKQDTLFTVAIVSLYLGFAAMSGMFDRHTEVADIFFSCGCKCFGVLAWLVVYSISRRSIHATLPTLCMVMAFQSLGVAVGAMLGHWLNAQAPENAQVMAHFSTMALVVMFIFLWCGFKSFSFRDSIESLVEIPVEAPSASNSGPEGVSVEELCAILGSQRGLTPREIEIMSLLARGRNASYIQEKLVISRNTTKSHIKNIYGKLDVHSHQELIDLVEGQTQFNR